MSLTPRSSSNEAVDSRSHDALEQIIDDDDHPTPTNGEATDPTITRRKRKFIFLNEFSFTKKIRPYVAVILSVLVLLATVVIVRDASWLPVLSPTSTTLSSQQRHQQPRHNTTTIQKAIELAHDFVRNRQQAYRQAPPRNSSALTWTMQGRPLSDTNIRETWRMRGVGYVWSRHKVVLAALLPSSTKSPGRRTVQIFNTVSETAVNCTQWTIWVRVNGPEIFAGSAQAVNNTGVLFPGQDCHWEFPFDLQVPGDYVVDVRLLVFNGKAPPQGASVGALCETQQNFDMLSQIDAHPLSTGFLGFKFYSPMESCCEICTREPLCRYWVSPPLSLTPAMSRWGGCELFFDEPADKYDQQVLSRRLESLTSHVRRRNRRRQLVNIHLPANESIRHPHFRSITNMSGIAMAKGKPQIFHGKPYRLETSYFIGCGWSFWHTQTYPCLDSSLDDAVPVYPSDTIQFSLEKGPEPPTTAANLQDKDRPTPRLCTLEDEYPRGPYTTMSDSGRWVRLPWPDKTECPQEMKASPNFTRFEIMEFDGDHPRCWFRDDLSIIGKRCMEYCAHRAHHVAWRSSLREETQHYSIWKNYQCDYLELTDAELQQCVNEKRIGLYSVQGASISLYVGQYIQQRLSRIKLYAPPTGAPVSIATQATNLTISTFKLPHLLWHMNTSQWRDELEKVPSVLDESNEYYFLTGFYYSSEREPWVTVEHAESLSQLMQQILVPKGWRLINAFDVTAAFTYEAATQEDGLHMIGPPMKLIVTKILHHLCKNHVRK
jgi:hypothetical protein